MNSYILGDFVSYFAQNLNVSDRLILNIAIGLVRKYCDAPRKYIRLNLLTHDIASLIYKVLIGLLEIDNLKDHTYLEIWDDIIFNYYYSHQKKHKLEHLLEEINTLVAITESASDYFHEGMIIQKDIIRRICEPIQSKFKIE